MTPATPKPWFALRVRTKSETLVSSLLERKGYESFAPTYTLDRRYASRVKRVQTALFPGYVFCRFNPRDLLPVVTTSAVNSVVSFGPNPEPIPDWEIERVQRVAEHGSSVAPWAYMREGQRVRVQSGALAGVEGYLVSFRNGHRLVIAADLLQRAVSLEIDAAQVLPT
jgi:transcription antitermination factor NusG